MTLDTLDQALPWTKSPLIVSAPMRLISSPRLAVAVSRANGLGFIGAGTDLTTLSGYLKQTRDILKDCRLDSSDPSTLPVGIGIICHSASLQHLEDVLLEPQNQACPPIAFWFFAPKYPSDLEEWTDLLRTSFPKRCPQIWVQVGSVQEAVASTLASKPDVVVVQGIDAGGHGLAHGASLMTLFPEIADVLQKMFEAGKISKAPKLIAAGGIVDGRGAAAAMILGADGICMGTRYLASFEAEIDQGYRQEVLRASDGGQNTVRTRVYDSLRGTLGWPDRFNGRGIINRSYVDSQQGMAEQENMQLYEKALTRPEGWGPAGRLTTYAGTGVGLISTALSAGAITEKVRCSCAERLQRGTKIVQANDHEQTIGS